MTASRHIAGENTDLAVRDLAGRTSVLASDAARCLALLEKAGLIDDQNRIVCGKVFDNVIPHDVAQGLRIPLPTAQNSLLPPRPWITSRFSAHPTGLAPLVTQQTVKEKVR